MSIIVDHKLLKHALRRLKDVKLTGLSGSDILLYDDFLMKWVNSPYPEYYLDDLLDVEVASPADFDTVIWGSLGGKWIKRQLALWALQDVIISSPANDQVLTYDGPAAKWKNKAPPGGTVGKGFKVYMSANFTLTLATWYDVPHDTIVFDDYNECNLAQNYFVPSVSGRYLGVAAVMFSNAVDASDIEFVIQKDTPLPAVNLINPVVRPGASGWVSIFGLGIFNLVAGYIYKHRVYSSVGGVTIKGDGNEGYTFFSLTRLF